LLWRMPRASGDAWKRRKRESAAAKEAEGNWIPSKAEFLLNAEEQTFIVEARPKALGKGFGWSKAGGRSSQPLGDALGGTTLCSGPSFNANVLNHSSCGLDLDDFIREADEMEFKVKTLPFEFSTGSLGWEGHKKMTVSVFGKKLQLQCNLNCPILGSKGEDQPAPPAPKNKKIEKALKKIGKATAAGKDDLKKVSGIGPFIEARLNGLGIFTFQQVANMTVQIEDDVNEAIEYFPGRVRRDEWVAQCKEFVDKGSGKKKASADGAEEEPPAKKKRKK